MNAVSNVIPPNSYEAIDCKRIILAWGNIIQKKLVEGEFNSREYQTNLGWLVSAFLMPREWLVNRKLDLHDGKTVEVMVPKCCKDTITQKKSETKKEKKEKIMLKIIETEREKENCVVGLVGIFFKGFELLDFCTK